MRQLKQYLTFMTDSELQMVHDSSLRILAETGMEIPHIKSLKKCEEAGAIVDYDKERIKIPVALMEDTIKKVQAVSRYNYGTEERNTLAGGVSTQIFYYDYKTGSRRYGVMDDVMKGIKLLEEMEQFPGTAAVVVPSDIDPNLTDVMSYYTMYSYAKKEGSTYILTPTGAKYIVEMSRLLGRSCGYLFETVSPLRYRRESLEIADAMIDLGCGLWVGPMVVGGASGPITIAGKLALQNAEILGSMFVGAALTGDYGFGYGSGNHTMDMHTMLCSFGSPNQALLGIAAAQMGRYYGLWSVSNNGLTDSLAPDYQCGMEKASNSIFPLLAGCGGMGGQGIVGADQGISLEQIVLDNEFMRVYNYIMSGFEVNEETLAFDIIKEAGIGGNFISEMHTVEHMSDSYFASDIFTRTDFDSWSGAGSKTAFDRACERVESITGDYKKMEPVVSSGDFEELTRIKNEAEKEILSKNI